MKIKVKKWKIFAAVMFCLFGLALAGVYCIYSGCILINNPSRSKYPIRGVDVSHYQGTIDWEILGKEGISFAYIKATEGSSHVDPQFAKNWKEAGEAGVRTGAYHFFSFDSPGQGQLEHFTAIVGNEPGRLPPVVDFEFYGDKKVNPPAAGPVAEQLGILLDGLKAYYGVQPVIYATEDTWKRYIHGRFDQYPLWIRNVRTRPHTQSVPWTFWQYSNKGRLNGYTGEDKYIDLNVFAGTEEQWEAWSGPVNRPPALQGGGREAL